MVGVLRTRLRCATVIGFSATLAVVAGYTAFMVAFLRFLDREGGASGDYGVVYRDEEALARLIKQRGLAVADQPALELLASGRLRVPKGRAPLVRVRNTLVDSTPFACTGQRRSVGPLLACLPSKRAE